jgi:hypothetical protein
MDRAPPLSLLLSASLRRPRSRGGSLLLLLRSRRGRSSSFLFLLVLDMLARSVDGAFSVRVTRAISAIMSLLLAPTTKIKHAYICRTVR